MFVHMWMAENVFTIGPKAAISEAAEQMAHRGIRRLPVVTQTPPSGKLIGIVSASDILRASPSDLNPFSVLAGDAAERRGRQRETVEKIMHRNPRTTTPDAPIEHAARVMRDHKIGALPVVRDERVVGLITESDIFRAFVGMLEAHHGARITFDLSTGEDPFPLIAELVSEYGLHVHSFNTNRYHELQVCAVQVTGREEAIREMTERIWSSKHRVLQVLKLVPPT